MWNYLKKFATHVQRKPAVIAVAADDERVTFLREGKAEPITFAWSEVDEIQTYKLDLFTVDQICLAFHAAGHWHELGEHVEGFMPVAEKMRAKFPSIPEDWYLVVMFPAFEANQRTLWKRDEIQS